MRENYETTNPHLSFPRPHRDISLAVLRGSLLRFVQLQTLPYVLRDQFVRTNCLGREDTKTLPESKSSDKKPTKKAGRASGMRQRRHFRAAPLGHASRQ